MKATLLRQYPSKKKAGQTNYTYVLDCSPEELELYKKSQGDYFRLSEDNRPLYFTDKFGVHAVKFSTKGEPYADTSAFDNANSVLAQMPDGILKTETAKAMAQAIIAQAGINTTVSTPTPEPAPAKADSSEDLGSL